LQKQKTSVFCDSCATLSACVMSGLARDGNIRRRITDM
jgi:hypothetical protein